ncbi:TlpA family protein disulfide reductase [Flavobacterium hydrophilum]|uniref:TlpA family protein disulfide reductase n=1 Tax=Flavobacterium hydrophilum TaxID=2211445 RepID=A0A2V4C771_9FLAO|nr:TlpA disulfide reductase family protein [Flavobacterium hydrophilum]PXY47169.1 TlpA family protein disulfide reductase [Flavobacterium hydrophilum]
MRLSQFIFVILLPFFAVCQGKKTEITISGKITGKIPETIEYTLPINGIDYFGFTNSAQTDAAGNFQIKIPSDKTCFIELSTHYQSYGVIIAEPGMTYKVSIHTEVKDGKFKVESKNEKAQALYNQIPNRNMIVGGHFELETKSLMKDSIISRIKQKLEQKRETEIAEFQKLLKDKTISKNFYNLVQSDRNFFYKGAQGSLAFINYLLSAQNKNALSPEQYKKLWKEIFLSNPVNSPELLTSPWFYYYTENYLRYQELIVEGTPSAAISEYHKQGLIHTHNINNAKKYLTGQQLEYYFAAYIYYESINKNYEKELITLFEQFKKEYPNSPYTHFLEPVIIPVIAFHKKKEEPLNEKIKFIDKTDSANLVKDVIKELNGKRFYIDIWATWCGPCKEEFKHNAKLYELLKSKGITMVYISIDKDNRDKQWKEMAQFYNLEGYHIRANEKLDTDLRTLYGNQSMGIPWHFLTDENGTIIKKSLSGPSEIENLEKQLNEVNP